MGMGRTTLTEKPLQWASNPLKVSIIATETNAQRYYNSSDLSTASDLTAAQDSNMTTNGQSLSQDTVSTIRGIKRESLKFIKNPIKVGLWNVKTLYKHGNKDLLVSEMERYKLDMCGVCETHLTGSGSEIINGWLLVNSDKDDHHTHGVVLLLSPRSKASLMSYISINERILKVRLYATQAKVTIIVAYAPTEDTDVTIKDNFYADLQAVTDDVPRHGLGNVLGDFNAKVGCDNSNWSRVMGTHGLGVMNENGSRLVEYCAILAQCCLYKG